MNDRLLGGGDLHHELQDAVREHLALAGDRLGLPALVTGGRKEFSPFTVILAARHAMLCGRERDVALGRGGWEDER
ncbi:hypothetical protein [Methylobacterium indicum]|uniref:hypothetical protein n=1 Tax=Methylobacterium indicum TaxID=1775910 RepID=UPI0010425933|nr:hypothetical protein [Methylobacterium indicum]